MQQAAESLLSEPRRTLTEPRRTLKSHAASKMSHAAPDIDLLVLGIYPEGI